MKDQRLLFVKPPEHKAVLMFVSHFDGIYTAIMRRNENNRTVYYMAIISNGRKWVYYKESDILNAFERDRTESLYICQSWIMRLCRLFIESQVDNSRQNTHWTDYLKFVSKELKP